MYLYDLFATQGIALVALSTQLLLLNPHGCGKENLMCRHALPLESLLFYFSIYLVALGNGGYQPSIATFGADQFDEEDSTECASKLSFFSWFYLAFNLGSLVSNTILGYLEDKGMWALGFWLSGAAAGISLLIYLSGTPFYRHHKPGGNPLTRFAQVFVAAIRKHNLRFGNKFYELPNKVSAIDGSRKILHSEGFRLVI
jgi:peptide/histidine transporter 3/4